MKKIFLLLCLSLYTYISEAQETSKIGHFQGLTYYHEKIIENDEQPSENVIYYPEEKIDTVYIIEKVIVEKPVRPRVTINFGMGWSWDYWNYAPYYGWGWNYPYRYTHYYSYWGYPIHGYYRWNDHYSHYYTSSWHKKTPNNYKVRTNQRYTNVSQIRKPQSKVVSNSERRIKQSTYNQRREKSKNYDAMYPSSRIRVTKSVRDTKYITPRNKPVRNNNTYKRNYQKSSSSNAYRTKSYSSPSRSNSNYAAPSRSSRSNSFSSGSRNSSSRSINSGTRSSGRSSGSSRGGRQ